MLEDERSDPIGNTYTHSCPPGPPCRETNKEGRSMSALGEYAQKAEQYVKDNPDKFDQGIESGEKFADDHTGHRNDEQISEGGEQIERHLGAGQRNPADQQEGAQPDGGQRQEQVQEDTQNDDQDANHS